MVNVASSVGQMTGVENGVRRYLEGARRPGDLEQHTAGKEDTHMANGDRSHSHSHYDILEQLPPYGSSRPPSYREEASPASIHRAHIDTRPLQVRNWSNQLVVSTSGLSVAFSQTSRNSLRYCLNVLNSTAQSIQTLIRALQTILDQYERTRQEQNRRDGALLEEGERPPTPERGEDARKLADMIRQRCTSIMQRLSFVVESISKYTAEALPTNARAFVREQLFSLPQRWQVLSAQRTSDSETSRSAHQYISFANEGLEMMSQVSGVLSATLNSAEQWLARVGRSDNDHVMTDAPPRERDEKS